MDLNATLAHLYPDAIKGVDYETQDDADGEGSYIAMWKLSSEQPTRSELGSAWNEIAAHFAWDPIRPHRDRLLIESDTVLLRALEAGTSLEAIRVYRQALRDVTKGLNPQNPIWPPKPF